MASRPINLAENKLLIRTDPSFVEFADINLQIPEGSENLVLNKAILYHNYREKYAVEGKFVTMIRFKKWLDIYCKARNINIDHFKSDGNNLIRISKME